MVPAHQRSGSATDSVVEIKRRFAFFIRIRGKLFSLLLNQSLFPFGRKNERFYGTIKSMFVCRLMMVGQIKSDSMRMCVSARVKMSSFSPF